MPSRLPRFPVALAVFIHKDNPKNKGDNLMLSTTGLPETLEEYVDFSMVAQAEGLKYGIEHFRPRQIFLGTLGG